MAKALKPKTTMITGSFYFYLNSFLNESSSQQYISKKIRKIIQLHAYAEKYLWRTKAIIVTCLRVIVNEKPLNLEKTTSSVLSVFVINLCAKLYAFQRCKMSEIRVNSCILQHFMKWFLCFGHVITKYFLSNLLCTRISLYHQFIFS